MTRIIRRPTTLTIGRERLTPAIILTRLIAAVALMGLAAWALFYR